MIARKAVGIITKEVGAFIDVHEQMTADFLAKLGSDILFVAPSRRRGSKTPDMKMGGLFWEIKSPEGNSSRTIENILRHGSKQARNIVLDLRRTKRSDEQCIAEARTRFEHLKSVQRIYIITKNLRFIKLDSNPSLR